MGSACDRTTTMHSTGLSQLFLLTDPCQQNSMRCMGQAGQVGWDTSFAHGHAHRRCIKGRSAETMPSARWKACAVELVTDFLRFRHRLWPWLGATFGAAHASRVFRCPNPPPPRNPSSHARWWVRAQPTHVPAHLALPSVPERGSRMAALHLQVLTLCSVVARQWPRCACPRTP